MYDSGISLTNILTNVESVLRLEYRAEDRVEDVIQKAVERLENAFGMTLDKDLYTLQSETQLNDDKINKLLAEIMVGLQQLTFFIQLKLYHKNFGITMADVNYLGYTKQQLITSLKYLQDDKEYAKHHEEIIPPLYHALNSVSMCTIKRLFICMLMLDKLGVLEGVAIFASLLYIGGLIV